MTTTESTSPTVPETSIPEDEDIDVVSCPYCDRPFRTERVREIHLGQAHADRLTDHERERYEAALDDEADDLFIFHLKVVAALVVLSMGFVYIYAFVWAG